MKTTRRFLWILLPALALIVPAFGADTATKKPPASEKAPTTVPATKPAGEQRVWEPADVGAIKKGRDDGKGFLKRHEGFLADLKAAKEKGDVQFVLIGDSITDGWRRPVDKSGKGGLEVFTEHFGKYNPLNIGISGDRTEHVLWRIENGEIEGISPKVAMLMIGTNNLSVNSDEEIAKGVKQIIKVLNQKLPKTKVLLLAVFPRGREATDANRKRLANINADLQKYAATNPTVKYLDIGPKFLDDKGVLPPEIMPDALHPNAKGYGIWAEAVEPTLKEMMK